MFIDRIELDSFDSDLIEFSKSSDKEILVHNGKLITKVRDFVTVIFIDWDAVLLEL